MNLLNFDEIIKHAKQDSSFALNYLKELYNYNMDNLTLPLLCDNPLTAIKCFIPLPTRLLLNDELYNNDHKIIKLNDEYQFHGQSGNRIIFGDKILPFINDTIKLPIPFSFPIYTDTNVIFVLSNIYYYELSIENTQNITEPWYSECISIGFGNNNSLFESHVGWHADSIGFHSDDGSIRFNQSNTVNTSYSPPWIPGDIIGAGIIYIDKNIIKPFFTFNGVIVYIADNPIKISVPYFPIIGYDHSHSIKLNFSNKQFKFDIKTMINKYSNIIISTDNIFLKNKDISILLNKEPKHNYSNNSIMHIINNFLNINDNSALPHALYDYTLLNMDGSTIIAPLSFSIGGSITTPLSFSIGNSITTLSSFIIGNSITPPSSFSIGDLTFNTSGSSFNTSDSTMSSFGIGGSTMSSFGIGGSTISTFNTGGSTFSIGDSITTPSSFSMGGVQH